MKPDISDLRVIYNDTMNTSFKAVTIRQMAYIMDYVEALEERLSDSKDTASYPNYGQHHAK